MALNEHARARIQQAASPARQRLWLWASPVLAAAALALTIIWSPWSNPEQVETLAQQDEASQLALQPSEPARDAAEAERRLEELDITISSGVEVEHPVVSRLEAAPPLTQPVPGHHTESFQQLGDNPFQSTAVPGGDASTFAIDVDTASYTLVRRMLLQQNRLPPADAVRIEEFINYFRYAYTPPEDEEPFAVNAEVVAAPWQPQHRLLRMGIQGKSVTHAERPASNLVFLIDVSGSMGPEDRLPLAQRAFPHLVQALDERDSVSIVTYANGVSIALSPTPGDQHQRINATIQGLRAFGGTAGGAGLAKAYRLAQERFIPGGVNRVILVTDGDFNVGVTDHGSLVETVRHYADQGIRITVLGVGTGNLHDHRIEQISNRGNGVYRYLDSDREAQRVFTQGLIGDLVTIASDVKTQVFFNPQQVAGWRLIGYQNRRLAREDFNDDSVDAGDIGAGHQVTALYEIIPAGLPVPGASSVDDNPFIPSTGAPEGSDGPMLRLRLRHKRPDAAENDQGSALQEFDLHDRGRDWSEASPDTQWAASVAAFAMALRNDPFIGDWHWSQIRESAEASGLSTADPQRQEFLQLIDRAAQLQPRPLPESSVHDEREAVPNDLSPAR